MKSAVLLGICLFSSAALLAQNVGIGSTTPTQKLDVNGNIRLTGAGRQMGTYSADNLGIVTNSTERITVLSGGNVGIGITSPTALLHVRIPGTTPTLPTGNWTAFIDNTNNAAGNNGLMVAAREASSGTKIFEAASYFDGSTQTYTPVFTVSGDRSITMKGDFKNQDMGGLASTTQQLIPFNASNSLVTFSPQNYVQVVVNDGSGTDNSGIIINAHVTVSAGGDGSTNASTGVITYVKPAYNASPLTGQSHGPHDPANGTPGNANWGWGIAGFKITLERATNAGFTTGNTDLISTYGTCGLQVPDWYSVDNNLLNAAGIYGDRFDFPVSASISYSDLGLPVGTYYYRLRIVALGSNAVSGSYSINDRSLTFIQIKR